MVQLGRPPSEKTHDDNSADTSLWDTLDHTPSPEAKGGLIATSPATLVDLVVLNLFHRILPAVGFRQRIHDHAARRRALADPPETHASPWSIGSPLSSTRGRGGFAKFMRFFTAWLVLFGSKFVILEALALAFDKDLRFGGPWHGIVALIAVVVAMLAAEAVLVVFYRRLG